MKNLRSASGDGSALPRALGAQRIRDGQIDDCALRASPAARPRAARARKDRGNALLQLPLGRRRCSATTSSTKIDDALDQGLAGRPTPSAGGTTRRSTRTSTYSVEFTYGRHETLLQRPGHVELQERFASYARGRSSAISPLHPRPAGHLSRTRPMKASESGRFPASGLYQLGDPPGRCDPRQASTRSNAQHRQHGHAWAAPPTGRVTYERCSPASTVR